MTSFDVWTQSIFQTKLFAFVVLEFFSVKLSLFDSRHIFCFYCLRQMIGSIWQHDYRAVLCMLVSNVLIELILVADSLLLIYIKKN